MTSETTAVLDGIVGGQFDNDLEAFKQAIKERGELLKRRRAAAIKVGDMATLEKISPKYMIGATVKVVELLRTRASVKIVSFIVPEYAQGGRFRVGGTYTVPMTCLVPLETLDAEPMTK